MSLQRLAKAILPARWSGPIGQWWRKPAATHWVRSLEPISRVFGMDRGTPIDRHYIEAFLQSNKNRIRGRVLEIGDNGYTRKFGDNRVSQSDVLHAVAGNPAATIIGDLATGAGIPTGVFDCIILTQTLPFIFDPAAAVKNAHTALAPGGAILATVGGISQISRYDMDRWGDFWRFTDLSVKKLFTQCFNEKNVKIETHGNVLSATAFLYGMAAEDLSSEELATTDGDYQVTITVLAVRASSRNDI